MGIRDWFKKSAEWYQKNIDELISRHQSLTREMADIEKTLDISDLIKRCKYDKLLKQLSALMNKAISDKNNQRANKFAILFFSI